MVVCGAYLHPDMPHPLPARGAAPGSGLHRVAPTTTPSRRRWPPSFDACFTNERTSVPRLREANPDTHYLPMGYDPARARAGEERGCAEPRRRLRGHRLREPGRAALPGGLERDRPGSLRRLGRGGGRPPPGAPPPRRAGGQRPRRGAVPQGPHRAEPLPGDGGRPRGEPQPPGLRAGGGRGVHRGPAPGRADGAPGGLRGHLHHRPPSWRRRSAPTWPTPGDGAARPRASRPWSPRTPTTTAPPSWWRT